jgi:hypothetical protein
VYVLLRYIIMGFFALLVGNLPVYAQESDMRESQESFIDKTTRLCLEAEEMGGMDEMSEEMQQICENILKDLNNIK